MDTSRRAALEALLAGRIALLDGATGTFLASRGLTARDYGGERLFGCHEALVLHRPDVVSDMHASYLTAGADIVETDTFGATPVVLAEYSLASRCLELNRSAASLARAACAAVALRDHRICFVAGSIGPTTKALTLASGITFSEIERGYAEQVAGLAEGGADVLLIETSQDPLNLKAALVACRAVAPGLPVAVSATIEPTGTTLGGQTIEAVLVMVEPWQPLWVGLNCSTGPIAMTEQVRALAALAPMPVAVVPNAGLPDPDGRYLETPADLARAIGRFAANGWVNLIGGCCGTTPEHIQALRAVADGHPPRVAPAYDPARLAGSEAVEIAQQPAPLLIGERTNLLGSRAFKTLIREKRFAEAAEIGRRQVRSGAHVLDLCLADSDGDESADMAAMVVSLRRSTRAPLMIDSTDPGVLATALELAPGRPVLNSVNLEDGGARLDEVAALARRFGAMVVAGCIDEHPDDGMARTAERKLEIARRLLDRLATCGLRRRDVLLDALVFPAATGDPKFRAAAAETVRGVRLIQQALPDALTVLGISNVSFGVPPAGRAVLNAVFLHHCVAAGLDAAIVNTEQFVRFPTIDPADVALAEAVLFDGRPATLDAFVARFRSRQVETAEPLAMLPAGERVRRMVLEGTRTGLAAALDELLQHDDPLAIINGPLMAGMDEVGRQFGDGALIVAEVLVSAEVMQAAVDHLRPHLRGEASATRGSLLLATVRGDVHDIGKNLVGIIFSTNGYRVVDLGVQCPSDRLIAAWRTDPTDLIGLSGLLVRSAHQMVAIASDLSSAGIDVPLLVGGAALSGSFSRDRIGPAYSGGVHFASDAMAGLAIANRLVRRHSAGVQSPGAPEGDHLAAKKPDPHGYVTTPTAPAPIPPAPADLAHSIPTDQTHSVASGAGQPASVEIKEVQSGAEAAASPAPSVEVPRPPDYARHVVAGLPIDEVFAHLNAQMLLGKHLGVRGSIRRLLAEGNVRAAELAERVARLEDGAATRGWLRPAAVWQFHRAFSREEEVILCDPAGRQLAVLPYPRQPHPPFQSAADWVGPRLEDGDSVAIFVVTAGAGVRERAAVLADEGHFLDSIALQALALETAEAAAEWLHRRLREMWGFPDPPELSMEDRFRARYRGIRLSFGYSACPALEPQTDLFRLLSPAEIGVRLTDGLMMDPEASVTAVVFHHPDARYLA